MAHLVVEVKSVVLMQMDEGVVDLLTVENKILVKHIGGRNVESDGAGRGHCRLELMVGDRVGSTLGALRKGEPKTRLADPES